MGNWLIAIPEAATNLITNPSFETNTTGWTTDGTNTIAQSSAFSKYGYYSAICTYQNDTDLARYTITLTATAHAFSCWVYLASNWDGGAVQLALENFTSVTTDTATTTTTTTGDWVNLEILFTPDAGDLTGDLIVETASAPTAGRAIYIDGADCVATGYTTTHVDGDQDGCEWTGAEHASTSTRDALSRAGGRWRDLADYYGLVVERMIGLGTAPVENVLTPRVVNPGAVFENVVTGPRVFSLVSTIRGTSLTDYHDQRNLLIDDIAPDALNNDPLLFKYTGASIDKQIKARYSGGMTMEGPTGFAETVALQFVANNPLFTQIGETGGGTLDTNDTGTFRYIAGRVDGVWDVLGPPHSSGTYASIQDIEKDPTTGIVYIGGDFTNFDNIAAADRIVQWDGSSYSALASGMDDGLVYTLKIKPDGNLLAGGTFTSSSSTTTRGVAEWNGSSWSALGPPTTGGTVWDVEVGLDGTIYVAGAFTNWDGIANADGIAAWDGTSWSALSTGANNDCYNLAVDSNGDIFVCGIFTSIGGVSAEGIAKWDGTSWSAVTTGADDGVHVQLYFATDGSLFAGGSWTQLDGTSGINRIAQWNRVQWSGLGVGVNGTVHEVGEWKGNIIAGGEFFEAGGVDQSDKLAHWDGGVWSHFDLALPGDPDVLGMAADDESIYIGFNTTGSGSFAGSSTVTPGGNAVTYPIITISRTGGTTANLKSIVNETTQQHLWASYDLLDGETVTLDFRPENREDVSSYRGQIFPFLGGNTLTLLPNTNNVINAFIETTGSPTITATIKWIETYWSID
jgi:hypothetical protein